MVPPVIRVWDANIEGMAIGIRLGNIFLPTEIVAPSMVQCTGGRR